MDRACLETLEDFDTMSNSLASLRNSLSFAEFSALRQSGDNERVALPLVAVEVESASESASAAVSANFAWTLSAYALIIVLSLAGNVLVMLAIVLNRCMHTSRHYLVFNLAVCHLTLLVACVWVDMVKSVNDYWPLGSFVCKLNAFAQIASVVASTLTLVLIAVAQIRATLNPPSRMSPVSPRPTTRQATRTLRWIGLVWLVSACVAVPSFAYRRYSERHWSDFVETFCDDSGWPVLLVTNTHNGCTSISRAHKRLYRTLLVTFLFLVPFAAVCVAYLLALAKMWTTSVNDYYVAATVELSIDARDDNDHEDTSNQQSSEKKKLITFMWISTGFFICWAPLQSMSLVYEHLNEIPAWWSQVEWLAHLIAYSHSAITPFVYILMSGEFRKGLVALLLDPIAKPWTNTSSEKPSAQHRLETLIQH